MEMYAKNFIFCCRYLSNFHSNLASRLTLIRDLRDPLFIIEKKNLQMRTNHCTNYYVYHRHT